MGVYGIGIDLVRIDRIEAGLARWGNRFLDRVFTVTEQRACLAKKNQAACLAMRFAAKEAFAKAVGTGIRAPLFWKDMEVLNAPSGRPVVHLSQRAQGLLRDLGIHAWHVSLTDDGLYGAAVVVLETLEVSPIDGQCRRHAP